MSDQRNLIVFGVLTVAILLGWSFLFPPAPSGKAPPASQTQSTEQQQQTQAAPSALPGITQAPAPKLTRSQALAKSPRVEIDAPRVVGSVNLIGARLDDLRLKDYRETIDPKSQMITLLSPSGTPNAYYADFGWTATQGTHVALPGPSTKWQVEGGRVLRPNVPLTLKWDNGEGLVFHITYAIDKDYMFTVDQEVENKSGHDIALTPYGVISRFDAPKAGSVWFAHEGFAGWLKGNLKNVKWKKLREDGGFNSPTTGGWLGFTDKYWMASIIPPQSTPLTAILSYDQPQGAERFAAAYQLNPVVVANDKSLKTDSHFFAGAKVVKTIDGYENSLGIKGFDLAIDWGWARFLTKPVFMVLEFFNGLFGNFGLAILAVTVCVKILFYPLANRSYETAAKMKKLQPQLKVLQERYKDDKVELQKQMGALYQKEKLNPLAGCLPVFLQIPVWYSLYNVLFITIEMRHAPFFGWIQDLSARDPTSVVNLFGLLPFHSPAFMAVGLWPLIMGLTMFLQTSLTPSPATDPTQKMIFTWMPILWTFMLASMPAGLVIYWTWNNFLSIVQQTFIMRRMGTPVEFGRALGINYARRLLSGSKARPPDKKTG